ncbi:EAL and GGDEF domain-containing protein [Bacillus suaedae]|uniref:EAL domain-containing protein n=1 Tax=Halalkalibacter suaedae TaxID=2822140 RepID=A0A940WYI9_9BACI|nr:EAL domain-containing protein [Bacillus suaedae]MBP3953177.1 EAL domain-containing protein [Bacillus suaedae]
MMKSLKEKLRSIDFLKTVTAIDLNELEACKLLFGNNSDLVIFSDLNGVIIDFNDAANKVLGYERKELLDQSIFSIIQRADHTRTAENLVSLTNGKPQYDTYTLKHKDGSAIVIENRSILIKDGDEQVGFIAIGKNVTYIKQQELKLKHIQENYNHIQAVGNTATWDYDVKNDEAYWSKHMYTIFGFETDAITPPNNDEFVSLIHHEDRELFINIVKQTNKDKKAFQTELRILKKNGEERIICMKADVILDAKGELIHIIGTIQDITDQRRMESLLKQSEDEKQIIYDNLDMSIWSFDVLANKIIFCSKGFTTIYGKSPEQIETEDNFWRDVVYPDDFDRIVEKQADLFKGKTLKRQFRIIHPSGQIKWVSDQVTPTLDENGTLIRIDGITSDVTEQKQAEAQMNYLAHHDFLTELPNRRVFQKRFVELLEEVKCSSQQLSVIYLNIDRMKYFNDTLGHFVGDAILQEVSRRLLSLGDSLLVARMVGDEFAVVVSKETALSEKAIKVATEIMALLEDPVIVDDYELYITTSIGISVFPDNGTDQDQLMINAIAAMNQAKQRGKNNYQLFSQSMGVKTQKSYSIEQDIRKALLHDEFAVYYQPRVDAATGEIVSAEALIRWQHPEKGMIPPGIFIPIAEEAGLITEIGDVVATKVSQQLRQWMNEGAHICPISINVSAQGFLKTDLIMNLVSILETAQISPTLIELEITESSYLNNMGLVIEIIAELKKHGFRIALDDFGTGYSSLTHLRELKIDTLKIDRSFIRNITENKQDEIITSSVIQLAQGLNLKVVAEGVECQDQLELLKEKGCDQIQGYLFSKPVPTQEFEDLLKQGFLQAT